MFLSPILLVSFQFKSFCLNSKKDHIFIFLHRNRYRISNALYFIPYNLFFNFVHKFSHLNLFSFINLFSLINDHISLSFFFIEMATKYLVLVPNFARKFPHLNLFVSFNLKNDLLNISIFSFYFPSQRRLPNI